MRNAFADEITKLAAADASVVLLSGDIGNRMFEDFKRPMEEEIGFRNRVLLRIPNTLQTSETPLDRTELWYDPQVGR